jgi:hypothetical protein
MTPHALPHLTPRPLLQEREPLPLCAARPVGRPAGRFAPPCSLRQNNPSLGLSPCFK